MDQFSLYESFYGRETARFALFWSMQILSMVFLLIQFQLDFDDILIEILRHLSGSLSCQWTSLMLMSSYAYDLIAFQYYFRREF